MAQQPAFHPLILSSTLELHQRFMPGIQQGALLVSVPEGEAGPAYQLGDPFYCLLQMPGSGERYPLEGVVVWLNRHGEGPRRGVGVQLPANSPLLRVIEGLVRDHQAAGTPNWTF